MSATFGGSKTNSGIGVITPSSAGGGQISGTVAVSGEVFVKGSSGIDLWQDSSGILGVTIVSSNIVTTVPVTSGSVIVSGSVSVNSGLVGILSGSIGAQISGTVSVSGGVIVSGTVNVLGTQVSGAVIVSGNVGAQVSGSVIVSGNVAVLSGLIGVVSGNITINSGVIGATVSGTVRVSGTVFVQGSSGINLWEDSSGVIGVTILSSNIVTSIPITSGSVIVSGNVGVSGSVTVISGLVTYTNITSGSVIVSGNIGQQGAWGVIVSGAIAVSGTVGVSGKVFTAGSSGINFWEDASGVLGVTIISSNITVAGGGQVSGTVAVSGGVIVSGTVNVPSAQVSGTVAVSGVVFVKGSSGINIWQDASGVVGVTIISGVISVSIPITSGSVIVSGTVAVSGQIGVLSGLIGVLSGSMGAQVSGAVAVSGGVIVSGTVQVAGNSGFVVPQLLSGWAHSGATFGDLSVSAAISESVVPTRQSGQPSRLAVDGSGNLKVTFLSGNIVRLGSTAGFNVIADVTSPTADNIASNGRAGLNALTYPFLYDAANSSYNRLQTTRSGIGAAQVGTSGKDYVWVGQTAGKVLIAGSGSTFAVTNFLVTFASGGGALSSGVCAEVQIKNRAEGQVVSGSIVYIGGSGGGTNPFSGYGYALLSGESITMHIDNLNDINVWAASSGLKLQWMAT